MKSAIISVGTELLFGQIVNTNAAYLSGRLNLMGIDVMYHYTVGDNPGRLEETLHLALRDCDLILTTGGLGPTQDDLTKEVVSRVMEDKLVLRQETLDRITGYFRRMNRVMTENNKKQAFLPSRAVIFDNDAGTAPGFALENKGKAILCFPGPPREMTRMFEEKAVPFLEKKTDSALCYKMVRTFGIGESQLETELLDLISGQTDPTLATYAKEGECSLRIASKRNTREEAQAAVDRMLEQVRQRVGRFIYSTEDRELAQVTAELLLERNISISCAESCTGGLFAETLTRTPGISAIFDRGFITYSNRSKMELLGVRQETLDRCGAVSAETAAEMARGVRQASGSRLCIAVTGVAGPGGGTEEKPVGLVYTAALLDGREVVREARMRNVSRQWNRHYAVLFMLDTIYKLLLDKEQNVNYNTN